MLPYMPTGKSFAHVSEWIYSTWGVCSHLWRRGDCQYA